ncbi:MFS transporter [Chryseosolibacter indicus]|uniref:MFS transporter n=1 Tax=Chryseosolibacter indicus TaxID=2782351 RepID=A0ABS5VRD8_9BACT|nr:MFS transporter [Chryseosolibacter indicus]MBT1703324.1 MFS transporter [Chryseosolibacter indicus]
MDLRPRQALTEQEVNRGLKLVIGDGLAAEAMTTFTGGAFLVAMALLMGASNFQIGLLAAMPTFTNLFQLISIWLVRRFNNRRIVAVFCSLFARVPLIVIGVLALLTPSTNSINLLIFFLFFYYLFGSIAGPSWNSWMKDLVPEKNLGTYFAKRSSYTQTLNVVLSLLLAFTVDFVKSNYAHLELRTYATMFITGGSIGIIGALVLGNVKEPRTEMTKENIFKLFMRPLRDGNFQRLLFFNSGWNLALSIATPFFTVFMMKSLGLSLSFIIALSILSQLSSIFTIRMWGKFADRYSNKTIIAIGAPLYILCIIAWCFVGLYKAFYANMILLACIHIFTGISTAGINLSITNLGLKLAPKENAIVYLSARNMILSLFGSVGPLIGGRLADYFMNRSLTLNVEWESPSTQKVFHLISLHEWNFLFLIGALLALIALELLVHVKEVGEVEKELVVRIMRSSIKSNLKDFFVIGTLISWHEQLWEVIKRRLSFR